MKKVLIITYYWPPAGGPGVQRWLKFVKYLRDYDIEPVVYIPENANYPIIDTELTNDIAPDLKVYRHPIFEPYQFARFLSPKKTKRISSGIINTKNQSLLEKLMLWIRGNLFIPDARKFWVKPSVKFLKTIIQQEGISTIITTGPPHSVHLIGLQLKSELKLKWIADFRDPWTTIGYHKKLKLTNSAKQKHKKLEQQVLQTADKIIVTSPTTKKIFESISTSPIVTITNGYDSMYQGGATLDEKFSISHIGSLLSGRNPKNLWRVLAELISENDAFKKALQLNLVGVVSTSVLEALAAEKLMPYVQLKEYVSHEEAIHLQQKSQVLLLLEIDSEDTVGIIPGKLFEYLAAKRPILAVGPQGWDVKTIISETTAGTVFNYQAHNTLKQLLLDWFTSYQNQSLVVASTGIENYSRRSLTEKLAQEL